MEAEYSSSAVTDVVHCIVSHALQLITRVADNNDSNDFRQQVVVAVQFVPLVRGGG